MSKKSDGEKQTSKSEPVKGPAESKVSNTIEWVRFSRPQVVADRETTVFQTRPTPAPPVREKK